MSESKSGASTSYIIHSVISVVLMLLGWVVPPIGGITELGMKVLFIFLGSVYAWCLVEFVWPSILAMLILGLSGYATTTEVFVGGFGHATVLQLMFIFVFVAILDASKITDWIANTLLSLKIFSGHPWLLTLAILYLSEVMASIVNLFGVVIMIWAIFGAICRQAGYVKGDKYVTFMIIAIMFLPTCAVHYFPFLPLPLVMIGILSAVAPNVAIPYGTWYLFGLIFTIFMPLVFVAAAKFILRIDLSAMQNLDMSAIVEAKAMTGEQKFCAILLVIFIVVLALPAALPAGTLKSTLNNLTVYGAAGIPIVIACCRRKNKTERVTNFTRMAANGLNWDLLCMFAATYPISAALESADCGIISTVLGVITPFFQAMGGLGFVIVSLLVLGVLTQVMHNLVLLLALLATLSGVAVSLGVSPVLYAILMGVVLQTAFITPGASAQSALIFGNTEQISSKDTVIYTTIFVAVSWVFIFGIMLPLGLLMF